MRKSIGSLLRLALSCLLLMPLLASAALISASATNVSGNRWTMTYEVTATDIPIDEFTIYFDHSLYANLALVASPPEWDSLVVQPDPGLSADGFFDALALNASLAPGAMAGGFEVAFDFLGNGAPGTQSFDLVDPSTFEVLGSGRTVLTTQPPPDGEVSEPGSKWLMALALFALWFARRGVRLGERSRTALALGISVFLSACGGDRASQQAQGLPNRLAATSTVVVPGISVTGLTKTGEVRVGRTVYDYTFRVNVSNNSGSAYNNVQAALTAVGPGTVVVDGTVVAGDMASGANVTPTDVIVLRHDRNYPFNLNAMVWQVTGNTINTPPPGDGLLKGAPGDQAVENVEARRSTEVYPASSYEVDPATGGKVLRELVAIGFAPGTTVAQINGLLAQINGRIVSSQAKTAVLFVRIPDPGSLPALEQVLATIGQAGFVDFALATRFAPPASVPAVPFPSKSALANISNHIAARGHLAWNARAALGWTTAAQRPVVVITDEFGGGTPASSLNSFNFASAVDTGISNGGLVAHGYHVTGIVGGTFDDALAVTGAYPGKTPGEALTLEPVDRIPAPTRSDEERITDIIKHYVGQGRRVVINTSLAWESTPPPFRILYEKRLWLRLIRGGFGLTANPSLENSFFHATAAGNNKDLDARDSSGWSASAIDGDLDNTAVVEDRTNGRSEPFAAGCLRTTALGASHGGNISAFGTDVWSYADAAGTGKFDSGSSMASPQVAGFAAYMWSINPNLSSVEIRDAILNNAKAPPPCNNDGGSAYLDAYAAVLAVDDAAALASPGLGKTKAPARLAILDLNGDDAFRDDDALQFIDAFAAGGSAFEMTQPIAGRDRTRYDLNGNGILGGTGKEAFNLNIDYSAGRKHNYTTAAFEMPQQVKVELDEAAVTDLQVLCYYTYSKLFSGDVSKVETALQNKGMSCRGPLLAVELQVNDTNANWSGLPATIRLSGLYNPGNKALFSINGNSSTCGNPFPFLSGERGGPIFSSQVESGAVFMGARVVTGMPSANSGPGVNRNNCSSFYAAKTVQDPQTLKLYEKIWVNATGRGVQVGFPTTDWEYQIRYYSGDPLNNYAGGYAQVGVVPNSGNFALNFNASSYSVKTVYGPAP